MVPFTVSPCFIYKINGENIIHESRVEYHGWSSLKIQLSILMCSSKNVTTIEFHIYVESNLATYRCNLNVG